MKVIAHRGASKAERENTLVAFRRAYELGADWVELDARRTADGALIVHHDPRLSDGRNLVDLVKDQLPDHVPSLFSALAACAPMGINIEIKNDPSEVDFDPLAAMAGWVVDLIAELDLSERVLISTFHLPTLDRVRVLNPELATAWLVMKAGNNGLETLLDHGHRVIHPSNTGLTEEQILSCHAAGVEVNVWTVDEPGRMRELMDWGVDGICTNVPDVMRSVIRGRGA